MTLPENVENMVLMHSENVEKGSENVSRTLERVRDRVSECSENISRPVLNSVKNTHRTLRPASAVPSETRRATSRKTSAGVLKLEVESSKQNFQLMLAHCVQNIMLFLTLQHNIKNNIMFCARRSEPAECQTSTHMEHQGAAQQTSKTFKLSLTFKVFDVKAKMHTEIQHRLGL